MWKFGEEFRHYRKLNKLSHWNSHNVLYTPATFVLLQFFSFSFFSSFYALSKEKNLLINQTSEVYFVYIFKEILFDEKSFLCIFEGKSFLCILKENWILYFWRKICLYIFEGKFFRVFSMGNLFVHLCILFCVFMMELIFFYIFLKKNIFGVFLGESVCVFLKEYHSLYF